MENVSFIKDDFHVLEATIEERSEKYQENIFFILFDVLIFSWTARLLSIVYLLLQRIIYFYSRYDILPFVIIPAGRLYTYLIYSTLLNFSSYFIKFGDMSWLTDFTSKAENLLTKFDQSAAQTFNESSGSTPSEPGKVNTPIHNASAHVTTSPPSNYRTLSHGGFEASAKSGPPASINSGASK